MAPIFFMLASIATLGILAAALRRKIVWTIAIGIILFAVSVWIVTDVLRVPANKAYSVFFFSIPSIVLALIFSPRRQVSEPDFATGVDGPIQTQTNVSPTATQGNSSSPSNEIPEPKSEAGFLAWLSANNIGDVAPEQLEALRNRYYGGSGA